MITLIKQLVSTKPLLLLMLALVSPTNYAHKVTVNIKPVELRCELLKGYWVKNIRDALPEFSWEIASEGGMIEQQAYQLQVWPLTAKKPQLLWDSEKQVSNQSFAVSFQGQPLKPNIDYQWRVKVWGKLANNTIIESDWSGPQTISMAQELDNNASYHDLITSDVSPKYIKKMPSGRYLIDFGKVSFGYLELAITSNKSGRAKVFFGERGSDLGIMRDLAKKSSVRFYTVPLNINAKSDVYRVQPPKNKLNTKSNKAIAIPGRFGRIAPFRYIEIEAKGLTLSDISAIQIAVHYPFNDYASFFHSSDETLNAIWALSKYSMKATSFAGVYVDGDRERIPYEADAYINQLSHYLVDDEYSIARHSHEYLLTNPTWPTEWKQHSIMMAWTDWMYTGDLESIREHYDTLVDKKSFINRVNSRGLLESFPSQKPSKNRDIVDWPPSERDNFDFQKINTVVNAFHYLNLKQLAEMANAIGKNEDGVDFQQRAEKLYNAFNEQLFNENTDLYVDGEGSSHSSAHGNILPLAVGLVPLDKRQKIFDFLKSKKMAVSVYFAQYLLEALYLHKQTDEALNLLTSKGKRSWFNMLRVGSTITLEAWDDEFKPNQDWNHAWGAVPGNIVGRYILGIKPIKPGFKQFVIAPQLGSLTFVEGKVPSIVGDIWLRAEQIIDKQLSLTVEIPNNSAAKIILPNAQSLKAVTMDKKLVAFDPLTGLVTNDLFHSGTYKIVAQYQ
ncbi:alpha-L-rhamnosidase C-terminal domain-containing protein [Colwellia sp. 1_MG-2023]|uniref:alpha-L-rhamnosidase-related protein n=1 Tax=Colwellia sp. 1_MG-2023 TaxID=3062649 RepID=UPI0026E2BE00|nr:alpha-L-rhamnosidase C-terminal domain-containing protein [Colwellia sp. 1_MG-2023]MDO6446963.1 alpha-L-rhamnosidase C-terminal domain-containing protein [Colwellia sp. 1_MG-2023]